MKPVLLGNDGTRLESWRGTGLGLRSGAVDPAWCARVDKPLLLMRRSGGDVMQEAFPFHAVAPRDGQLEGRAQVQDQGGGRWDVRLAARPRDPDEPHRDRALDPRVRLRRGGLCRLPASPAGGPVGYVRVLSRAERDPTADGLVRGNHHRIRPAGLRGRREPAARRAHDRFLLRRGDLPSGLFFGLYQDGKWEPGRAVRRGEDVAPWRLIRTSEDAAYYLIRACRLESGRGSAHPACIAAVRSNLDAFVRLWERYGEAADSESCLMFPPSFLSVYERTGEARFLRFAMEAADQLASWVLAFDGVFPKGSTLDRLGIQTIGGIIASAQNHHIGPGGATSSLSSLLGIYRASGEARFLRFLEDCASGLPQYLRRYDGYMDRLAKGMMTEQINLADSMNHEQGEIWPISASWGATNVLLTRVELPGVYVDPPRAQLAVFDHVEASVDWGRGMLEISNPTEFTARTSVQIEGTPLRELTLARGARATVKLKGAS